jgi:hypothetical protein
MAADEAGWASAQSLLATDRPVPEICLELHERRLLPAVPELDELLATEADWLDAPLFDELLERVRRQG